MRRWEWAALLAILLAAAFLRFSRLDAVPPGWRDDELINSLVISQHALDGKLAFFYPDASGHEALYHVLNAGMLYLFGPGVAGIRWLSAGLGVLSVALTFWVGRLMFGRWTGWLATVALAMSFWSLMYSRIGLRHVSLLPCMLGAWGLFWMGVRWNRSPATHQSIRRRHLLFILAGVLLGVSFFTYFAARGLPALFLAIGVYWWLFDRQTWRQNWPDLLLSMTVALLLAIPLVVTLARLPEMTGRVEELAVPLVSARTGDLGPLLEYSWKTIGMFFWTGDGEWLYNIAGRPVLNWLGGLLLVAGLVLSAYRALFRRAAGPRAESAFLLLWFLAGIAPGFVSVPPASLGHTIVAQPASYLLVALPLGSLLESAGRSRRRPLFLAASLVLALASMVSNGARDLRDYFVSWPERGMVQFLYRAEYRQAANLLNEHPEIQDVGLTSALAGPWDRQAFLIDLDRPVEDRWYDPRHALVVPQSGGHILLTGFPEPEGPLDAILQECTRPDLQSGGVRLLALAQQPALAGNLLPDGKPVQFENGLTLEYIGLSQGGLLVAWRAESPPFNLPPSQLVSNPPPPGVDTRPRLMVFAHLLDEAGQMVAAADGFWADPYSLRSGDLLIQWHEFSQPVPSHDFELGLYDPVSGLRVRRVSGEAQLVLPAVAP